MAESDIPPNDDEAAPDGAVDKFDSENEDSAFIEAEEFRGALNKLTEREPEVASMVMGMMGTGMMGNPLHQKMDGTHITQLLDLAHKHDEREFQLRKQTLSDEKDDRQGGRRYVFAAFVIVTGLFVTLLLLFEDKPEILIPSLTGLGGLVSGFVGGWGLGRRKEE